MEGLRKPVGDQPPEVYWKRRLIAGVSAAAILVLLVWVVTSALTSGSEEPSPGSSVESSVESSGSTAQSADTSASRACAASDVVITTTANPTAVAAGALPVFDATVTQDGPSACKLDTDADGTELLITSGEDRIYSSADCPDDETIASKQLILEPGSSEDLSVTWSRQRSAPECTTVTAEPGPGTYKASLAIQGIQSEVATFTLEG